MINSSGDPRTLTIDIGGTGIKMLPVDGRGEPLADRARMLTPKPAKPDRVCDVIRAMLDEQAPFDRVSVGFPGVVMHGVVKTAVNLDPKSWLDFDLQTTIIAFTGKPVRVMNDADLQGYGVIEGRGTELVLTLGTGLGSALFVNGHLVPNLELGHHPLRKDQTYEELVSNAERKRIGKKAWRERMDLVFETLGPIFNYDLLHVGGGNAKHLNGPFPENVRLFKNVEGLAGGVRLWEDEPERGS